jgi:tellurite resistance protein
MATTDPAVTGALGAAQFAPARTSELARRSTKPITPNLFAIAFGIVGLAETWRAAQPTLGTPSAVANALFIAGGCVWLVLIVLYGRQGARHVHRDLQDKVMAPFVSLVNIIGMLLAAALVPYAFGAGRAMVLVFLALTLLLGGWLTGQWIVGDLDATTMHPGYFLPTVAGGFLGAYCAVQIHLHALGVASFGVGLICWFLLGSLVLNRLFLQPRLPAPLIPTMAIEVAPPVVAGIAYAALSGGRTDAFAYALGGYAVLMVLVQLRLVPIYAGLHFGPSFWSFTFSYAAVVTDGLHWLDERRPPGAVALAAVGLGLITAFISAIAARTVVALARRQFLPPPPAATLEPDGRS